MPTTISDIMNFVTENDVKFVRLAFCDPFGTHKNISIMVDELQSAFEKGVPFDASSIDGFLDVKQSDLLLFPEPSTLAILPWRPYPGRVIRFYCSITYPDKTPFIGDSRYILKKAILRAENMGYNCNIGSRCEFYLFKTDENGEPTKTTIDQGSYLDISPLDKGEDIRREICLYLEEMELYPQSSHHEKGPGQNQIDFKFSDALTSADNLVTFKSVVKSISERNGLYASFMPKPILEQSGSGLHLNVSLNKKGKNIFSDINKNDDAKSFIEGVLENTCDMTLFLNPNVNSYERLGKCEAPSYVSWSHQNLSQLIRIPETGKNNLELRSADPSINPYIAFALIIHAGLDGIEKNKKLREAVNENLYIADDEITEKLKSIPKTLKRAIEISKNSEFIKTYLDNEMLIKYFDIKENEVQEFLNSTNKEEFYSKKYFKIL